MTINKPTRGLPGWGDSVDALIDRANLHDRRSPDRFPAGTLVERYPSGKSVIGVDGVNQRYFSVNSFTLWELNTPSFLAVQTNRGVPSGTTPAGLGNAKILRFKGTYYLSALGSDGRSGVWRVTDPDAAGAWTWSARLVQGTVGATVMGPAFNTDGQYLYWGEYGQPTGGPRMWRSSDGTTWDIVLGPIASINHVHGVNADPYNPGHVYAAFGDAGTIKHMRSTEYGASGTWTEIPNTAAPSWQAVQISFDQDFVYYGGDANMGGWTAFRLRKSTQVMENVSHDWHFTVAVPGGRSGRAVTDLVFNDSSTTMTSTSANFTAADVGAVIRASNQAVQENTVIRSVVSATQVTVSPVPLGNNGTTAAIITGDQFFGAAFYAAIDPDTGIFYCLANDGSAVGNTPGLFAITPDGRLHLLRVLQGRGEGDMFIANGYGWCGHYKWPLLTG